MPDSRVAQLVRGLSVNLASNNTSGISNGLLETNGRRTTVVWCYVDIQPSEVESRPVVDCDGAEKGSEEFDSFRRICEE